MNLEHPDNERNAAVDAESPIEALEVGVHGAGGDVHRFRNGGVVIASAGTQKRPVMGT